jgi:2-phosphoglycerate kinase
MCGMSNVVSKKILERNIGTHYKFATEGTLIFVAGAPLSGKSMIAPHIVSAVEGCSLLPMDVMRLVVQQRENQRDGKVVPSIANYGSCDSYLAIGDGSYSPKNLISGFNAYSKLVFSPLKEIIPKLEVQGAQNILFEGVQLTPSLVRRYLVKKNKLIILTSDAQKLERNRNKRYGGQRRLTERYSTEKLLLLQREILRQAAKLPKSKVIYAPNVKDYRVTISIILKSLEDAKVIVSRD